MEFVSDTEVMDLLRDHGITACPCDEDRVYLQMAETGDVVRVQLTSPGAGEAESDGAKVVVVEPDRLPSAVEDIIQKLHLNQVLLFPVGKWRNVFDAVAFSLADNEDWQEVDTTATVELNRRDPLLCEPGDFQIVSALLKALLSDAESPEQGLMVTTTAAPVLVEVVPDGVVRVSLGNKVLADEVAEALEA